MRSLGLLFLFLTSAAVPLRAAVSIENAAPVQHFYVDDLDGDGMLDDWTSPAAPPLRIIRPLEPELPPPPAAAELYSTFDQERLTALPPDPGPVVPSRLYITSTPAGSNFALVREAMLSSVTGGFTSSPSQYQDVSYNTRQYRDWLMNAGVPFHRAVDVDGDPHDYSLNLNGLFKLNPKAEVRVDHTFSQNDLLYSNHTATYDNAGQSAFLHYKPFDNVRLSAGYAVNYKEYNDEMAIQKNLEAAPKVSVEYSPFLHSPRWKSITLDAYGETRQNRYDEERGAKFESSAETVGGGVRWQLYGLSMNPGVSLTHEIQDSRTGVPDDVVSRYMNLSRRQVIRGIAFTPQASVSSDLRQTAGSDGPEETGRRISLGSGVELTRNLTLGTFYALRSGPQSLVDGQRPRETEASVSLQYKVPKWSDMLFLVRCGHLRPFASESSSDSEENRPRNYLNTALVFKL